MALDESKAKDELSRIIRESYKKCVGKELNLNEDISIEKLGLDSLSLLDLVTTVEEGIKKEFKIKDYVIPDEYFDQLMKSKPKEIIEILYKTISEYNL